MTSSRSTATTKLALPVHPVPVDVEEVVDQPHDQLGHQHRAATDEDLAHRSAGQRHEGADAHGQGECLTRVDRTHERPQLPRCPLGRLRCHGWKY